MESNHRKEDDSADPSLTPEHLKKQIDNASTDSEMRELFKTLARL